MQGPGFGKFIKIFGIVIVCIGVLLVTRTILFREDPDKPTKGEAVTTVIDVNKPEIPEIDQENCTAYSFPVNDGKPYFTEQELRDAENTGYFVQLSGFDDKRRAQTAVMCADEEHIVTEERDNDLSSFEPSGWHKNAIYERSHLLMWKLSGPDDLKNLITGTQYFNQVEMLQYETQVTGYLWDHPENHVLYRVTPYYAGDELVARGVLMEAVSLEDDGAFQMCVFVYNAQPGSEVIYETGAYHMHQSYEEALAGK